MGKLKIGIIGMGGIANYHIWGIENSPDAELYAICDVNEKALAERGETLGIPPERRYSRHEDILADSEVDAVMIGTPNMNHFAVALDAIRFGKPFALEKPIALDTKEALVLREELAGKPVPHIVCFSYRYRGAVRYARELIESGKLGEIRHVYSQYLQGWAISEEVPLYWRFSKELSGSGALGDLGSHILDLHRFLVGETTSVVGHGDTIVRERDKLDGSGKGEVDVDDFCHVLGRMENGISSSMQISRFAYGRGNYQRIEVYGSKGSLVYNLEAEDTLEANFEDEEGDFRFLDVPESYKSDQMQAFFDLLKGKDDGLNATIEDGYINQRTIDAIIESFSEGRWVSAQ
ncbi:Gfo/Idh/MocA family oxidoreductase [Paenibacillus sp. LHD-117]|uniref:Gfo/Idh/MocA family protein n=1 Tax=Paenibacillus sp. LHD-117 TaxID=3071412 RepID=UPI0027DFD341|nr:Gfo/Idh/MocA family oxidoreductase [Paenibacillus sp. LHD-117]MDQ6419792.1 Gfo/Idh/MocA family oxidoreductase [Paenibacillus sp. LHD-117]